MYELISNDRYESCNVANIHPDKLYCRETSTWDYDQDSCNDDDDDNDHDDDGGGIDGQNIDIIAQDADTKEATKIYMDSESEFSNLD